MELIYFFFAVIDILNDYIAYFSLQVWSVLESLDRDYKRDEDWCSTDKANCTDKAAFLVQAINKHNEQKEAFLKVMYLTSVYVQIFKKKK